MGFDGLRAQDLLHIPTELKRPAVGELRGRVVLCRGDRKTPAEYFYVFVQRVERCFVLATGDCSEHKLHELIHFRLEHAAGGNRRCA